MSKRIYLTTAIPYVNAPPHIGHALELVQSDALARFYRASGYETYWAWGADENSLKNVQAAEKEGVPVQEVVDKYAAVFLRLKDVLNLSFDVFNRTSGKDHFSGAQKFWLLCKPEDIYKKKYRGLYCVGCEQFYTEKELVGGKCPEHMTVPEEIEEENYFFRLTNYADFLYKLINADKLRITPPTRKNEVLSFIKGGLEDFSISRSRERARGWGVPVPNDDSQVQYVWFDALLTYLTAIGFPKSELYEKFWVNPSTRHSTSLMTRSGRVNSQLTKVHVIGKGIIRFHAVYWIAMLASAGVPLPSEEFVHGYITVDGQKISKSLGNIVDPIQLVDDFGADAVRYYLLREINSWGDGDFSATRFKDIYNGELANGLGNLVARVARLASDTSLSLPQKKNFTFKKEVSANLKNYRFDLAISAIWDEISQLDKQINEQKPWELGGADLKKTISPIAQEIREIGFNLSPFLPETSKRILDQFSGKVEQGKSLFPRI